MGADFDCPQVIVQFIELVTLRRVAASRGDEAATGRSKSLMSMLRIALDQAVQTFHIVGEENVGFDKFTS